MGVYQVRSLSGVVRRLVFTRSAAVCFVVKRNLIPVRMPESGIRADWDMRLYSPEDIPNQVKDLIERSRAIYDRVASVANSEVTYDNVIKILANVERDYATLQAPLEFPQHVATDKTLRDASTEAARQLDDFDVEMSMRKDVFDKIQAFATKGNLEKLEPEAKRYVERLIKVGRRNGLHLPDDVREEIKRIKKRMSELCITFQRNLNEENTVLEFMEEELTGLPNDFLQSLDKTSEGKLKVSLKYPHFFPIVRKAVNEKTRRTIETAYHSRCMAENTPILEELIELRHKQANLLGYPTHVAYITELRMAKTPEAVDKFLKELAVKLGPLWHKERETMLQFKKEECKQQDREFDGCLNYWDCRYYMAMVEEKLYAVDQNQLKEYFPIDTVTKGLLEIYQELLSLKFTEIENGEVWHPDVRMFRVNDAADGQMLGYFYLDLFPREGKFGHAAVFGLQPGCLLNDGNRQVAVAAMVANFTKPTKDKPSLLDHKEVETYFHEFGHVMHQMCAQAQFARFSGTRVERDFIEAPSQMLENWVWEKEPLRRMSGHYQDGSPLPDTIIEKLIQSQTANAGIFNLRQIGLATFDQKIHSVEKANTQQLFAQLFNDITEIPAIEGTNMPASFGHLAGGYDAQYYGYLWSEVFSMDMFYSRFRKEGVMNPTVGLDYRRYILQPGGSLDGSEMLRNFLGRDPKIDPFLHSKGLSVD